MDFDEFDRFTSKLCRETRAVILKAFESADLAVERKPDRTPVTRADREAERLIRAAIEAAYPDHGIVGEEEGAAPGASRYSWSVDPIDGTKSFATGCPLFGTLLALLEDGQPVYGCIDFPALDRRIVGDGRQARLDRAPVRARSGRPLEEAILLATSFRGGGPRERAVQALQERVDFARTWGDCYGYFLLSAGRADIMLDPRMNPWDIMALVPVARGAGAAITDWQGGNPAQGDGIVAANADLHAEVLALLREFPDE